MNDSFSKVLREKWPYVTDTSAWYIKSVALVRIEDCPIYLVYTWPTMWHYGTIKPSALEWMLSHCKWELHLPYEDTILAARYHGYSTR